MTDQQAMFLGGCFLIASGHPAAALLGCALILASTFK